MCIYARQGELSQLYTRTDVFFSYARARGGNVTRAGRNCAPRSSTREWEVSCPGELACRETFRRRFFFRAESYAFVLLLVYKKNGEIRALRD